MHYLVPLREKTKERSKMSPHWDVTAGGTRAGEWLAELPASPRTSHSPGEGLSCSQPGPCPSACDPGALLGGRKVSYICLWVGVGFFFAFHCCWVLCLVFFSPGNIVNVRPSSSKQDPFLLPREKRETLQQPFNTYRRPVRKMVPLFLAGTVEIEQGVMVLN